MRNWLAQKRVQLVRSKAGREFLTPVLYFAAGAINLGVNPLRRLVQVGDHEARVILGSLWSARTTSALIMTRRSWLPAARRIAHFVVDMLGPIGETGQ